MPAGIVTRSSIIIVDFIHLSLAGGRSLFEAIRELRGAAAPDPADGRGGDAVGFAHRDRPDLLGPGVGADIRPAGKQRATQ